MAAVAADVADLLAEGSYSKSSTVEVRCGTCGGSAAPYHLKYLTLRALGDLPALMLEASSTPYDATYYGKKDFLQHKASFPLGRLPVLEHNGSTIAQSGTVVRYLARELGTDGVCADFLYETVKELFDAKWFDGKALLEGLNNADWKLLLPNKTLGHYKHTTNREEYGGFEKSVMVLNTFESFLVESKGPWLCGDSIKYADLALFLKLEAFGEAAAHQTFSLKFQGREQTPRLSRFLNRVWMIPQVREFLASSKRMPKIERRDGDYHYVPDEKPSTVSSRHGEL
jgi:glutathione S-transferase